MQELCDVQYFSVFAEIAFSQKLEFADFELSYLKRAEVRLADNELADYSQCCTLVKGESVDKAYLNTIRVYTVHTVHYCVKHKISCSALKTGRVLSIQKPSGI